MKKNTLFVLFALCPLVPAASRFAYGIVLAAAMLWLFLWGLVAREIVRKLDVGKASAYIELVCLAASATIFDILSQLFLPVLSVALGFYVYLSAFSCIMLVSIDFSSVKERTFLPILPFIPVLLLFSGLRELAGSGTLSFPVPSGLVEIAIFPSFAHWGLGFWGTSGGALILLGIGTWLFKFLNRRISGYRRNA